jgi:hypothetical protein
MTNGKKTLGKPMPTSHRKTSLEHVEDTNRLGKVTLYHSTTRENAASILREGFRDRTGKYMTTTDHTGVWLSDTPLDENEGASSEALLSVELEEGILQLYEWVETGKGYREFHVPAEIVNRVPVVTIRNPNRRKQNG